jgi:hypothetical protein
MRGALPIAALAALAACNFPSTRFTPLGGDGGAPGDDQESTPARLSASPAGDIGLGTIVIGQTSGATTISVSNDGDLDSGTIAVTFNDTSLGFITSNDTCSGKVLSGHHICTFDLTFMPRSNAAAQTSVHVAASPGGEIAKLLSGAGLIQGQINITDAGFTFANHGLGAVATTKVFTVANGGQSQIGAPVPSINGSGGYSIQSTTCSAPLNQTDTCTVTVAFSPTTVGMQSASLVVTSTPGGQDSAQVSGTAFAHVMVGAMGGGGGTIRSTQPGISCPGTCEADFTSTPITLQAMANGTSTFAGWGDDCMGSGDCTLDLVAPKSATARFTVNSYALNVSFTSSHGAPITISSNPPGIGCDGNNGCTASFLYNTQITLTANPDPSSALVGWSSGPCAGSTSSTCTFNMPGSATSASAAFDWFGTMTILMNMGDAGIPPTTTQVSSTDGTINCVNTTTLAGTCTTHISRGQSMVLIYSGNPSLEWTNCKGGPNNQTLHATASGTCQPPDGVICSTQRCPATESCSVIFEGPGAYTSGYDVACEQ